VYVGDCCLTGRTRYNHTYEIGIPRMDIPLVMVVSCFHDLHIGSMLYRAVFRLNDHVQRLPPSQSVATAVLRAGSCTLLLVLNP